MTCKNWSTPFCPTLDRGRTPIRFISYSVHSVPSVVVISEGKRGNREMREMTRKG